MQVKTFLSYIKQQLITANVTSTPELEAALILIHALKLKSREQLFLLDETTLKNQEITLCEELLSRRLKQEPIAYLLGYKDFWDYRFEVNHSVLIPRPETELIIEAVQKYFDNNKAKLKILDLGTGSGCIPITLLKLYHHAVATAVDISSEAILIAQKNAASLAVLPRIKIIQSNWFENVFDNFDIITANPPYISLEEWQTLKEEVKKYEPTNALTDYQNGLEHYKEILKGVEKHLSNNGKVFFEIGHNQNKDLLALIQKYGYRVDNVFNDLANIPRVICFSR